MRRLYTESDTAEILRISARSLRRWREGGIGLTFIRLSPGNDIRYSDPAIKRHHAKQTASGDLLQSRGTYNRWLERGLSGRTPARQHCPRARRRKPVRANRRNSRPPHRPPWRQIRPGIEFSTKDTRIISRRFSSAHRPWTVRS